MTSLKFEYIDLEKLNSELQEKTKQLLQKTQQLETCNLALKSENIKLKILGKEKVCDQPKHEHEVNKLKNDLSLEKEKSRRMNLELSRIKTDLERENKWTRSSMIVTHLGNNTRNIKARIGYEKSQNEIPLFCSLCGKTGHSKLNCQRTRTNTHPRNKHLLNKTGLPNWINRDLIHPLDCLK